MTTTRFVIERIVLEGNGGSVAIISARDQWSDRDQLCIEIVTTDPVRADADDGEGDETGLALYYPEPPQASRPGRVGRSTKFARVHRAALATAIVAAVALSATVVGAGFHHHTSASRGSAPPPSVPVNGPLASNPNLTGIGRPTVPASASLFSRCNDMVDAASAALGTDDATLVSALVGDHVGQTLNDALHQELTDARAVLVSRPTRADGGQWRVAGLQALDGAIADVDATPCSPRDEGRVASP